MTLKGRHYCYPVGAEAAALDDAGVDMEALASIVQHNVAHKVAEVALLGAHRVCGAVQVHVSVPNHLHQLAHEGAFNTLHLGSVTW